MPELAETFSFHVAGAISVAAGLDRWVADSNGYVSGAVADIGTAPATTAAIFDIKKNGTSIYTDTTALPTIAAAAHKSQVPHGKPGPLVTYGLQSTTGATSQNSEVGTGPAASYTGSVAFVPGDVFTLDCTQTGTTTLGSDLEVTVEYSAA